MEYQKYQHIERLGTPEVDGIELGKAYVFPKIDGTNSTIWLTDEEQLGCGSRKRQLTLDSDNAGFMNWAIKQINIREYLKENPTHRLFGEWLVPHSLKTYREDAWRDFYVFDVAIDKEESDIIHEGDDQLRYLSYDAYKPLLEKHNLNYIAPISIITNGSYEKFVNQLAKNVFLIEDGKGAGEGIVIKNYDFYNKYGRQTWAKIVTSEFKEKHSKEMGGSEIKGKKMIEQEIVDKYVTHALCEKVFSNINNDDGWTSRSIPRLIHTVFYDLVKEDAWNFVKEHKNPLIDFKRLNQLTILKVKEHLPKLF